MAVKLYKLLRFCVLVGVRSRMQAASPALTCSTAEAALSLRRCRWLYVLLCGCHQLPLPSVLAVALPQSPHWCCRGRVWARWSLGAWLWEGREWRPECSTACCCTYKTDKALMCGQDSASDIWDHVLTSRDSKKVHWIYLFTFQSRASGATVMN